MRLFRSFGTTVLPSFKEKWLGMVAPVIEGTGSVGWEKALKPF
jgi:hypothetical protein